MANVDDILNIESYVKTIGVALVEAGKYFSLLMFSVLAIRLWRRLPRVAAASRKANLLLAGGCSIAAAGIGYFSMCHSLGLLYCHFGTKAFDAGNLPAATSLFQTSAAYWKNADAVGGTGICLLLSEKPEQGTNLLAEARTLRNGQNTHFEMFYEGLHYFFHEQPDRAVPLLEAASAKTVYQWNVTRVLSAIALEKNLPGDAERLMKPFAQVEVKDGDYSHAYVAVSLHLLHGKTPEAKAILDRFPAADMSPFWKPRFEKLRAARPNNHQPHVP